MLVGEGKKKRKVEFRRSVPIEGAPAIADSPNPLAYTPQPKCARGVFEK